MYIQLYVYVCVYVYVCIHTYVYIRVCMCVYMHMYVYVHLFIDTCTHIHIYIYIYTPDTHHLSSGGSGWDWLCRARRPGLWHQHLRHSCLGQRETTWGNRGPQNTALHAHPTAMSDFLQNILEGDDFQPRFSETCTGSCAALGVEW